MDNLEFSVHEHTNLNPPFWGIISTRYRADSFLSDGRAETLHFLKNPDDGN